MGIKHPDRIGPSDWRRGAETAGQMYEKCWELTAHCRACGAVTLVDLRAIICLRGPAFSLWNKHPRCRQVVYAGRCRGLVDFEFKAPGMTAHKPLSAPDQEPLP